MPRSNALFHPARQPRCRAQGGGAPGRWTGAPTCALGRNPRFIAAPRRFARGEPGALGHGRREPREQPGIAPATAAAGRRAAARGGNDGGIARQDRRLSDPKCVTTFDANAKVTTMQASAHDRRSRRTGSPGASIRAAGGLSNGIIDVAFRCTAMTRAPIGRWRTTSTYRWARPWKTACCSSTRGPRSPRSRTS